MLILSPEKFAPSAIDARALTRDLAGYRDPSLLRSIVEIVITVAPLALTWTLMWAALRLDQIWLYAILTCPPPDCSCGFS